jgi:hypothetical protein
MAEIGILFSRKNDISFARNHDKMAESLTGPRVEQKSEPSWKSNTSKDGAGR